MATAVDDVVVRHPNEHNSSSIRDAVLRHLEHDCGLDRDGEAREVERAVFNWALTAADRKGYARSWKCMMFASVYANKAKSVLCNLDAAAPGVHNAHLLQRMRDGDVKPEELPTMKPHQMFPERWQDIIDQKLRREQFATQSKPVAMTNQFRCSRCKKRECVHHELQLRSCDEPATQFITCLNCNNRWKIG